MTKRGFLKGKLLIAMPSIQGDDFNHSVVFLCEHNPEGAMGLVLNKPAPRMIFADLVEKLDIGQTPGMVEDEIMQVPVMLGGPVKQFQGFVLHSSDYKSEETLKVAPGYALTATVDVLRAIAAGKGPKRKILALGYAGWSAGQLEDEILRNGWLTCDADADLVFSGETSNKHEAALKKLGVDPGMLSSDAGNA
jgi:putative transcriptional regulator